MGSILRPGRFRRDPREPDEDEEMWFNDEDYESTEQGNMTVGTTAATLQQQQQQQQQQQTSLVQNGLGAAKPKAEEDQQREDDDSKKMDVANANAADAGTVNETDVTDGVQEQQEQEQTQDSAAKKVSRHT